MGSAIIGQGFGWGKTRLKMPHFLSSTKMGHEILLKRFFSKLESLNPKKLETPKTSSLKMYPLFTNNFNSENKIITR